MATHAITWEIEWDADSPREAALEVWRDIFGRGEPRPDDACVFTVNGEVIDLATEQKED